jgi:hypothetical protein
MFECNNNIQVDSRLIDIILVQTRSDTMSMNHRSFIIHYSLVVIIHYTLTQLQKVLQHPGGHDDVFVSGEVATPVAEHALLLREQVQQVMRGGHRALALHLGRGATSISIRGGHIHHTTPRHMT